MPVGPDTYINFAELEKAESPNSYSISSNFISSRDLILTPHGGGIEVGTSEIVKGIARDDKAWYLFEGLLPSGNGRLHVTSSNFNEPTCIAQMGHYSNHLAIHGAGGSGLISYMGGNNIKQRDHIAGYLILAGFAVVNALPDYPEFAGDDGENIVNRNRWKAGVQIELSTALRQSFFDNYSGAINRWNTRNAQYWLYVEAIRAALESMNTVYRGVGGVCAIRRN